MPIKKHISNLIQSIGYYSGISPFLAQRNHRMKIIMIHGVGGPDCPKPEFHKQMIFLKRYFQVISLTEMVGRLGRTDQCSGRLVALTFDDGLRNTLTTAYPILRALGLPATFFVCPGLIEKRCWLWNHDVRARLESITTSKRKKLAEKLKAPSEETEGIVEWMKGLILGERLLAEELIGNATPEFQPTKEQSRKYDLMGWDDLTLLDPELICLGAHTMTHPILTSLSDSDLSDEIIESQRGLENRIERRVDYFCYPNGAYDSRAFQLVEPHYKAAVTTESGGVRVEACRHRLPRITVAHKVELLAWRLIRPTA
jgi:peptidoglycan/xylan/chitin deacetylase (PgdA/CDA1 family)